MKQVLFFTILFFSSQLYSQAAIKNLEATAFKKQIDGKKQLKKLRQKEKLREQNK